MKNDGIVSNDLLSNVNGVCNMTLADITLDEALTLAEGSPCFSMMSLVTMLSIDGHYPVPIDWDEQQNILLQLSDQIVVEWTDCLEQELERAANECRQSDIDFDFVIDSSGSVGPDNWVTTMQMIGQNWIKEILIPNGSKVCGNHVAGRWFSTNTKRFYDFEPPAKNVYAPKTYADYVGDIFINQPYESGGTNTHKALKAVRQEDLPMARDGLKYVMVFTDGKSNEPKDTVKEADKLHQEANRTYALGIGEGIDDDELLAIASDPRYVGDMTDFNQLKAFVRLFILEQNGCSTEQKQPHRAIDLQEMVHYGMSYLTGRELQEEANDLSDCTQSSVCPYEDEYTREPVCTMCSENIAEIHMEILADLEKNITAATELTCFPSEIILAMVSRLSMENGSLASLGWRKCKLRKFTHEFCYGLMQIPFSWGPDTFHSGDSPEHFREGIGHLLKLTNQLSATFKSFTPVQKTRAGLAAYDGGVAAIRQKERLDETTTRGDFSADILARAKRIQTILYN